MDLQERIFWGLKQERKRDSTKQLPVPFLYLQVAYEQVQPLPIQMFSLMPQEEKVLDAQRERGAGKALQDQEGTTQTSNPRGSSNTFLQLPFSKKSPIPLSQQRRAQGLDDVLGTRNSLLYHKWVPWFCLKAHLQKEKRKSNQKITWLNLSTCCLNCLRFQCRC